MAKGRAPKRRRPGKRGSGPQTPETAASAIVTTGRRRPAQARTGPEPLAAEGTPALARLRGLETLESAYEAWLELKREHAAARLRLQEERERLDSQGSFLVGAVRAAGIEPQPGAEPGLLPAGAESFLKGAEARLAQAREELLRKEADSEAFYQRAFEEIRNTLTDRVRRYLEASRPRLQLLLRKVGTTRSVLHVARVGGDEAVLLCYLFTGRIPSRYGFLFDDSTEDVSLPPAPLYPDEGVEPRGTRPEAPALEALLRAPGQVLPLKGFLPVFVPHPERGEAFFRMLQRGPVMEVEVADGAAFRSILSRQESERFAGYLLRLKLEEKLELEIEAG